MTTQTIQIDTIFYTTYLSGPPTGPLILLTHALMSNSQMYSSTVHALNKAGYRTLRFDHFGHNLTPPPTNTNSNPSKPYTIDDIAQHMHALVQQTTQQPEPKLRAIIGCSIGGVLALRYAMLFPESVTTIFSLCAPGLKSPEETKPLWTHRIAQFKSDLANSTSILAHETVERWIPGSSARDERARALALEQVGTCSLEGYVVLADAIRGYDYDDEAMLGRLRGVECVVVAGGRDRASSAEGLREVAGRIGARFVLMEEAGHVPPLQCEEEFEEMVLEVLGGEVK